MNQLATITQDIFAQRDAFIAVAADKSVNFDKEAGFAIQVLTNNSYALGVAMKNRQSVADAVTNVAAIGISLNPAKKQAYLVPRKDRICLDISYIGLMDLAVATGAILWAQAQVVREHDNFVLNGLDKPPTHGHDPFAGADVRGAIKGAYVVVKTPDNEYLTHTMAIDAIYSIRDRSEAWKAGKSGPWKTDEIEMIKKTVVKQASKYWPKNDRTERFDAAVHLLNTDGGEGFEPLLNGVATFPAADLNAWVNKAKAATSADWLKQVWVDGLAAIKPSKDMPAYDAFKTACVTRGEELKRPNGTVIDVSPKPASGDAPTREFVLARLLSAKTLDQLNDAAALISPANDFDGSLNAQYEELAGSYAVAA